MRRQDFRWLLSLFSASVIAFACASEEKDSGFNDGPSDAKGGASSKGGSTSSGKGGASSGKGGASSGKGGSDAEGGESSTAGTSTGGTGGNTGGTGGTGGTASMGDCEATGGDGELSVDFKASNFDPAQQPGGNIEIHNDTGEAIAESEFSVRYYFTSEFACADAADTIVNVYDFRRQMPHDDSPGTGDVDTNVVTLGANGNGCDAYIEFVFTIDLAVDQYATLNFGVAPPNNDYNTPSNQSNDPTYGACTSAFVPWVTMPLYIDDVLTWGEEPDVGAGGAGGAGGGSSAGGAGGANGGGAGGV